MKSRDLIEALVAVLGVYELSQGLAMLPFLIQLSGEETWPSQSLWIAASAATSLLLGVSLVALRRWLAERLAAPTDESIDGEASDLLETLLAVAGVYFIVVSLAAGAAIATGDFLRADSLRALSAEPPSLDQAWPPRIRVLAQLALGIGLAVGRRGVGAALRSFRTAGTHRPAV